MTPIADTHATHGLPCRNTQRQGNRLCLLLPCVPCLDPSVTWNVFSNDEPFAAQNSDQTVARRAGDTTPFDRENEDTHTHLEKFLAKIA